jgi:hypothetical protein
MIHPRCRPAVEYPQVPNLPYRVDQGGCTLAVSALLAEDLRRLLRRERSWSFRGLKRAPLPQAS